jgi:FkbM family methyltransferase
LHLLGLPIAAGLLRGKTWLPFSGGKTLRLLLGTYEQEQTALFAEHIRPGNVVFDVGASVGYYTLAAAKLVGRAGKVVAFEPEPRNAAFVRAHVRANRLKNVIVYQTAVAREAGVLSFSAGTGTGTGRLEQDGDLPVTACCLDDVAAELDILPTHIKIDVEGAERSVLDGAAGVLSCARPMIFLSTHGKEAHAACCQRLKELGYEMQPINGSDAANASELFCRADRVGPPRPAGLPGRKTRANAGVTHAAKTERRP